MTINPKVIDISHYDNVVGEGFKAVKAFGIVGVVHKASEGLGNVDKPYAARRVDATVAGLLWGAYHFIRPGDIATQVDLFLRASQPDDNTLLSIDWEVANVSNDQAREFIEGVEAKTGRSVVVYSYSSMLKEKFGTKRDPWFGARRLWLAQYSVNTDIQVSWSRYWLKQYTGDGSGPGPHEVPGIQIEGGLDISTWDGTDDELRAQWAGTLSAQAPAPEVPPVQAPSVSTSKPGWWDAVLAAASASKAIHHVWVGRGQAPAGYIKGMALAMGYLQESLLALYDASLLMAIPNTDNDKTDALSWYNAAFDAHGMNNTGSASSILRHLVTLMIGLGMRESSGKFCEGRDTSADNVQSDTAEAGMFQMSWDIRGGSKLIADLFEHYSTVGDDPEGLGPIFHEGVSCSATNLANFGSGDGKEFQRLCKASPMFSIAVCGVGMRTIRRHWGPLNRHEAELVPDVDALLKQVQDIVDGTQNVPQA